MIAEPNRHVQQATLKALLDETLPRDQAARAESHLCNCNDCQASLERLAGDPQWWQETVNVLATSTLAPAAVAIEKPRESSRHDRSLDASLDWIRPLLDPCEVGTLGRIDQYPISDVIGQGGMGVVLRGTDTELHRPLAIKILSPHLAGVGEARARFLREAQAAASIIHPSIVPIYSIATAGRLPFIVMPWISGGNLQERIDHEGPLELIEILRIALQIAEGLAAAHRHGVIHRDIKPANILIEEGNGRVLISDFGLARALDDATLTMSGMIAGTPQFMSPEQARGDIVDARTDLFSLGSLIYVLATGRPPFRAESPLAVLRKISDSKPRPARVINERIPEWLDQIIAKLMCVDRNKRIQTADEAADILRESLSHARNPSAMPLPKSIRQGRHAGKWIVAGLAIALIGILVISLPNSKTPGPMIPQNNALPVQPTAPSERSVLIASPENDILEWSGASLDRELASVNAALLQMANSLAETSQVPNIFSNPNSTPRDAVPPEIPNE